MEQILSQPIDIDIDEGWIKSQVKFWYGASYVYVIQGEWKTLETMLNKLMIGKNVKDYLSIEDTNQHAVAAKYGNFAVYRFREDAIVMLDIIRHDLKKRLTTEHRFPITMTDLIGRNAPLIGYNRHPGTHTILWPLPGHYNIAKKGFLDTIPFDQKRGDRVHFRGALSGIKFTDFNMGGLIKVSRVTVLERWHRPEYPWADLSFTSIGNNFVTNKDFPLWKDRIYKHMGDKQELEDVMKNKYILCLEGVDVSTALGWVLASNCVPLCPYPFTFEIWYFNGLEPWKHFVPLKYDASDLDEVYQWCVTHEEECRAISENGRKHMRMMMSDCTLDAIKSGVVELWDFKGHPVNYISV